eukprot:TRINITY_DN4164_c0_g1_i4.p1 TRINITY_DN4164_c0_g1~~TRINITY_DN4164_c0_g1_i4.p1  ORF type:complete len:741 (+),score=162.45 TRINITY_DN4164_c0_g1_i4:470-2692(+)
MLKKISEHFKLQEQRLAEVKSLHLRENESLRKSLEEALKQNDEIASDLVKIRVENQDLTEQCKRLKNENALREEENLKLKAEIRKLELESKSFEPKLKVAEIEIKNLREQLSQFHDSGVTEAYRARLADKIAEAQRNAEAQVSAKKKELISRYEQKEKLLVEIHEKAKVRLGELNNDYKKKLSEAEGQLSSVVHQKIEIQKESAQKDVTIGNLNTRVQYLTEEVDKWKSRIDSLTSENRNLSDSLNNLLQNLNKEKDRNQSYLNDLKAEREKVEQYQVQISEYSKKLSGATCDSDQNLNRIKELERQQETLKQSFIVQIQIKNEEIVNLHIALKNIRQELEDLNVVKQILEDEIRRYQYLLEEGELGFGLTPPKRQKRKRFTEIRISRKTDDNNRFTIAPELGTQCIVVKNWSNTEDQRMNGWKIACESGNLKSTFLFPSSFVLPRQGTVAIYWGERNKRMADGKTILFWEVRNVWDPKFDKLRIQLLNNKAEEESYCEVNIPSSHIRVDLSMSAIDQSIVINNQLQENMNLKEWKVVARTDNNIQNEFSFHRDEVLRPGDSVVIYWGDNKDRATSNFKFYWPIQSLWNKDTTNVSISVYHKDVEVAYIHSSLNNLPSAPNLDVPSPIAINFDLKADSLRITNRSEKVQDLSDCQIIVTCDKEVSHAYTFRKKFSLGGLDNVTVVWGTKHKGQSDSNKVLYWTESSIWDVQKNRRIKADLINKNGERVAFAALGIGVKGV